MREILFRGKRADNGEWVEGCGIIATENWVSILAVIDDLETNSADVEEYEVIPETVGQYTGLTDKNGKKIFEGDILKSERFDAVGVVISNEWNCPCCDGVFGYRIDGDGDLRDFKWYEVVGNIHDNPELLK